MKKSLFVILIILTTIFKAQSQTSIDTLSLVENHYELKGKPLNNKKLLKVLESNPIAYIEMKKANSNKAGASVFAYTGGFLIGYPLGQALAGAKPNWVLAGIGAGLVLIAIPFTNTSRAHAANAIRLYNSGIKDTGSGTIRLNFCLSYNGASLIYKF